MPVRLRYLAHDLVVPQGEFVVGRSADCQLSLDDALISRRHALLKVTADRVTIEDLGSRNGVLVNGELIAGQREIFDGDRITIGGQEMSIHVSPVSSARAPSAPTSAFRAPFATLSGVPSDATPPSAPEPSSSGGPSSTKPPSAPRMTLEELRPEEETSVTTLSTSPFAAPALDPDKRIHQLSLIGGVADKALAMNRAEEAERLLQRTLVELLQKAQAGEPIQPDLAERAAYYAVRLASATGRGRWVDYTIELYAVIGALLPGHIIDELYRVVRKVKVVDKQLLAEYTAGLRERAATFGPSERFLQQRIEGLERLGALK